MASQLSPRQREILDLVADGRTSKEIAVILGITENTVNWHLANAFQRLGASSRAEAVALSMRSNGLDQSPQAPPPPGQAAARFGLARLVLIALAIALAGALIGGAAVATFDLGLPAPTQTPIASPANTSDGSPTSNPASTTRGAPSPDVTGVPVPASPAEVLPGVSVPPLPSASLPTPALPSPPVTPPPLPGLPLPTPIPTPRLPLP